MGKKKQLNGSNTIKPGCTVQVKSVEPKRVVENIDLLSVHSSNHTYYTWVSSKYDSRLTDGLPEEPDG